MQKPRATAGRVAAGQTVREKSHSTRFRSSMCLHRRSPSGATVSDLMGQNDVPTPRPEADGPWAANRSPKDSFSGSAFRVSC